MTTVRAMETRDLVDVGALCAQLGYPSAAEQVAARFARLDASADHAMFVAIDGAGVLGWIHAYIYTTLESDPSVEIGGLIVDAHARRHGTGRLLMTEAERWAKARGCSRIRLRSNTLRTDAHAFYERLGYQKMKTQFAFERRLT